MPLLVNSFCLNACEGTNSEQPRGSVCEFLCLDALPFHVSVTTGSCWSFSATVSATGWILCRALEHLSVWREKKEALIRKIQTLFQNILRATKHTTSDDQFTNSARGKKRQKAAWVMELWECGVQSRGQVSAKAEEVQEAQLCRCEESRVIFTVFSLLPNSLRGLIKSHPTLQPCVFIRSGGTGT